MQGEEFGLWSLDVFYGSNMLNLKGRLLVIKMQYYKENKLWLPTKSLQFNSLHLKIAQFNEARLIERDVKGNL